MVNYIYTNMKNQLKIQDKKIPKEPIPINKTYRHLNIKHLVTLDEFKKYLNDSNTISNFISKRKQVEINNAISIRDKRFTKYNSPSTDKQFSSLYNTDIIIQNQLNEMLYYFTGRMNTEIINIMIRYNKPDTYILKYIHQYFNFENFNDNNIYKTAKISDIIARHISSEHIKILDIGVGNGKKIMQIKEFIDNTVIKNKKELMKCDIYGADIQEWGPYKKTRKFNFPFKYIETKPYRIPYSNKMFDCITLVLTLHHCDDIIETIMECKRLLKDDGIIVIIEHDIWSDNSNMIIDLQHRIYNKIFNEKFDYIGTYYNFYEWDIIFNKCNFKPIFGDRITESVEMYTKYDLQFIGVYKHSL